MAEVELTTFRNSLQLAAGEKLTAVNEIYYDLVKQLSKLKKPPVELIERIKNGEYVTTPDRRFSPLVYKLLEKANKKYQIYCFKRHTGFTHILNTYDSYLSKGTGFGAWLRRYRKGYSYQGPGEDDEYIDFIRLIDRMALIDPSGTWIRFLKEKLKRYENNFNYANQRQFMDVIESMYLSWADHSLLKLGELHRELTVNIKKCYENSTAKEKLRYDIQQANDEIDELKKEFTQQKTAFKDAIDHVNHRLGLSDLLSPQEQHDEHIRHRNKSIAYKSSFITSIGEGFIAVSGIIAAFTLVPPLAALLIIGIAGWYINNLLFRNDSKDFLDDLFLKKNNYRLLFLDENGDPISKGKKTAILIAGCFTLFTGFVCGALNFMSTYGQLSSVIGPLLSVLTSSHAMLAIICCTSAAFPGLGMAIGISSIFFKVITDFIKNDRPREIYNYVKKTFFGVPWQEMRKTEKAQHIGKCLGKVLILVFAVAVTTITTIASFGVFYQQSLSLMKMIVNANPLPYIAKAASLINSIISFPFQIETTNKVPQRMVLKRHTFCNLSVPEPETSPSSPVRKDAKFTRTAKKVIAFLAATLNGLGQAALNMTGHSTTERAVTGACAFDYSVSPNLYAAFKEAEQNQVNEYASKDCPIDEPSSAQYGKCWRFFNKPTPTTSPEINCNNTSIAYRMTQN
ncbi:MAG: hypothetical protein EPO11_03130 [Gammaproteobacteria bacterium]|nr:MAG: hypothetical protein EPO11_03130 [Gammaproteobacteria bacterium]